MYVDSILDYYPVKTKSKAELAQYLHHMSLCQVGYRSILISTQRHPFEVNLFNKKDKKELQSN
jgi:hypothetical protein